MSKYNETAAVDHSTYIYRRRISAAHGSSIRKLIRGNRIEAGLRPLQMPRSQTIRVEYPEGVMIETITLKPTKGLRFERRFEAA